MRTQSPFSRDRGIDFAERRRSVSPNNYTTLNSNKSKSHIHTDHLWHSLQQLQLFPAEFSQLIKYQERNLGSFKKRIQKQKIKVNQQFDTLKRQIVHNIEDLKISIFAELDRVYRIFMEKYATFKGQLMEIKRLRDQIQGNFSAKKQVTNKYQNQLKNSNSSSFTVQSNTNVVKSMQNGLSQMKKYHILNYIAQMQKQKIIPLQQLSRDIIIMNQYDNGFYQNKQFTYILENLKENFRSNLRNIYDRKFEFLRDPDVLLQKDKIERPILQGIYQEPNIYRTQTSPQFIPKVMKTNNFGSQLVGQRVSQSQQIFMTEWVQSIDATYQGSIKSVQSTQILLCAIQVKKNQIAVGGKDGALIIYDISNGSRITSLRGHKASICSLAIVNFQGQKYLASGSDHGCSSIVIWDMNNWTIKTRLQQHKAAVTAITDLNDGVSIVSGSYDKKINIYNLSQNKLSFNLSKNKSSVTGIVMSARGSRMVSCGLDNTLNVWQVIRNSQGIVQSMFLQKIIENNTMICSFVGSLIQDNLMYIGTKNGEVRLIDIQKGKAYKTLNCCNNAIIQMIVIQRKSKPQLPIILCWPSKQENIKTINCENGKVKNIPIKGYIQFGCGIGPKGFILTGGKSFGMVSQSENKKQVSFFKIQSSQ